MNLFQLLFYYLALISKWSYDPKDESILYPEDMTALYSSERFGIVSLDFFGVPYCVAVHRGTDSFQDVVSDLESEFTTKVGPYGVNLAFYESYQNYSWDFEKIHYYYSRKVCKRWMFTGHSLGSVSAIISSIKLNPELLVTFGQPRAFVKNKLKIPNETNFEFHRVVNTKNHETDVVPFLPIVDEFTNMSSFVWKLEEGAILTQQKFTFPTTGFSSLNLHHIDSYIDNLITF